MRRFHSRIRYGVVVIALALMSVSSCTTDYVTGKRTFSLVSESKEIEMGREADPQIVAQYGLYDDPALSAFLTDLGQRLAKTSQRPQLKYTFRVVDSPVINAFALPGGWVYVTRGILAHFNSEDELAGVLGHEIGHVVARHGAEQMSRAQLAGFGLGLGALVSERFAQFAGAAGAGVGLLFLKFGRAQESESDRLGVEYSTKLGYDANRMAEFFKTLKQMRGESGQSLPGFLSTHPDPGDREVRVHQLASEWQGKIAYKPLRTRALDYLRRIDGIVYGDDPRQGYVDGSMFYHPSLKFQFPVPSGWKVANSVSSVQLTKDKDAAIQFTVGKSASPAQEADGFVSKNKAVVRRRQGVRVHGFPAVLVESTVKSGNSDLTVLSYFIHKDASVYVFHGFTIPSQFATYVGAFTQVMAGFESVTNAAVLNKKPRRIHLKQAPAAGTFEAALRSLGAEKKMFSKLALLNGRTLSERVQAGEWIKVVGD